MADEKALPTFHDAEEEMAVAAILEVLPHEHAARIAFRQGADPIQISSLVGDEDLAKQIRRAYVDGYARILEKQPFG